MRKVVAHPSGFLPCDFGMCALQFGTHPACGFAKNFQIAQDGIADKPLREEFFLGAGADELANRVGGVYQTVQVDEVPFAQSGCASARTRPRMRCGRSPSVST